MRFDGAAADDAGAGADEADGPGAGGVLDGVPEPGPDPEPEPDPEPPDGEPDPDPEPDPEPPPADPVGGGEDADPEGADEPDDGGAPVGAAADCPVSVTTSPPGEKVTLLVHWPGGAAAVALAVTSVSCPAASVPEDWLSVIHGSAACADQATGAVPVLRIRIVTLFGSPSRWLTLT